MAPTTQVEAVISWKPPSHRLILNRCWFSIVAYIYFKLSVSKVKSYYSWFRASAAAPSTNPLKWLHNKTLTGDLVGEPMAGEGVNITDCHFSLTLGCHFSVTPVTHSSPPVMPTLLLRRRWRAYSRGVVGHSAATGAYTRPTFGGSHGSRLLGVESSNPPPPATPAPRGRSLQAPTTCLMASTTWANNRGCCYVWRPLVQVGSKWQELPRVGKVGSAWAKECCQSGTAAAHLKSVLAVRQQGGAGGHPG